MNVSVGYLLLVFAEVLSVTTAIYDPGGLPTTATVAIVATVTVILVILLVAAALVFVVCQLRGQLVICRLVLLVAKTVYKI